MEDESTPDLTELSNIMYAQTQDSQCDHVETLECVQNQEVSPCETHSSPTATASHGVAANTKQTGVITYNSYRATPTQFTCSSPSSDLDQPSPAEPSNMQLDMGAPAPDNPLMNSLLLGPLSQGKQLMPPSPTTVLQDGMAPPQPMSAGDVPLFYPVRPSAPRPPGQIPVAGYPPQPGPPPPHVSPTSPHMLPSPRSIPAVEASGRRSPTISESSTHTGGREPSSSDAKQAFLPPPSMPKQPHKKFPKRAKKDPNPKKGSCGRVGWLNFLYRKGKNEAHLPDDKNKSPAPTTVLQDGMAPPQPMSAGDVPPFSPVRPSALRPPGQIPVSGFPPRDSGFAPPSHASEHRSSTTSESSTHSGGREPSNPDVRQASPPPPSIPEKPRKEVAKRAKRDPNPKKGGGVGVGWLNRLYRKGTNEAQLPENKNQISKPPPPPPSGFPKMTPMLGPGWPAAPPSGGPLVNMFSRKAGTKSRYVDVLNPSGAAKTGSLAPAPVYSIDPVREIHLCISPILSEEQ